MNCSTVIEQLVPKKKTDTRHENAHCDVDLCIVIHFDKLLSTHIDKKI
jgi:hypothetical protein